MGMNIFRHAFYECIEWKLGICKLVAISISDDWMVDPMIIYDEMTIAKALDINNIFKNIMGKSTQWVQISQ
jgi:hypothetical protein